MNIRILRRATSACGLAAGIVAVACSAPAQAHHAHGNAAVVLPAVRVVAPGPAFLPPGAVVVPAPITRRPVVVLRSTAFPVIVTRPAAPRALVVRVIG